MCGIVGYVGEKLAIPMVLECLKSLEYRGYDSAGIAYVDGKKLEVFKRVGKLKILSNFIENKIIPASCAIGHTRWATHGEPSEKNAHPHTDNLGVLALAHNGIIENFSALKKDLNMQGVEFYGETDTEVFAKLLQQNIFNENAIKSENYAMHSTMHNTIKVTKKCIIMAIKKTIMQCTGSYAVVFIFKGIDDVIFFAKNKSPLIIGESKYGKMLASDTPALLGKCEKFYTINDGEFGYISKRSICIYDKDFNKIKPYFMPIKLQLNEVILGEHQHFMQKEIEEGAKSVLDTLDRLNSQKILAKIPEQIFDINSNFHITACGTALHAGRIAKYLIENQLGEGVDLDYASEFRYKRPQLNSRSVCLCISQSGETADTLSCLELSKEFGATTLAVVNVRGSRMESIADYIIPTSAGPEIAVASTKAYLAQLGAIYALIAHMAKIRNKSLDFSIDEIKSIVKANENVNYENELKEVVELIKNEESVYFVGRGLDYLLAMEASLKLKEITYIHSEALPAGELKHGSLALISEGCVVFAILTQSDLIEKTLNNVHELNSRGAKVVLFTPFIELKNFVYKLIKLPNVKNLLAPFVALKPLQTLAYLSAISKNLDPDKPRNLAKSVTVE